MQKNLRKLQHFYFKMRKTVSYRRCFFLKHTTLNCKCKDTKNLQEGGCVYHSKNSHKANGYGVLFDSLCDQIHQQHQHVVDSLMNLRSPLVHRTRCQQLQHHLTSKLFISSHTAVQKQFLTQ